MDYFGRPWNVPALEDARRTRRPLGRRCGYCRFRITLRARGFMMPTQDGACSDDWRVLNVPWHRECLFSTVAGHVHGMCGCTFPTRTPRERFRLSVKLWNSISPPDLQTRLPLPQAWADEVRWLLPPGLLVLDVPFNVAPWKPGVFALCGLAAVLALVNVICTRHRLREKDLRALWFAWLLTILGAGAIIASLYIKDFHG